jgi:hypothetical protein
LSDRSEGQGVEVDVGDRGVQGAEVIHSAGHGGFGGLPVGRVRDETQQPVGVVAAVISTVLLVMVMLPCS